MLSGERAILIKSFIEDRERLGTVSQKPIESVFDKNIYSSILSHKEQKSLEESIHLIQDNSGEIDLGEMMDNMKPPERNNEDNDDMIESQDSNIYEHEIKSILLTDMMSKKENEDQSTLKSITVSPESLESEEDKKKRNKRNKKNK
tara:strand:- start:201 stop:638 length:438 start_codon:yes stop_codon:yes gene_type:complete